MNDDASEAMIRTREEQWGEADYRQIEKRGWLGHWACTSPEKQPSALYYAPSWVTESKSRGCRPKCEALQMSH
jgi:hypothetical protein